MDGTMKIALRQFHRFHAGRFSSGDFLLEDGVVRPAGRAEGADAACEGGYLLPPLLDSHIHGGWGVEFETEESFFFLEEKLQQVGIAQAIPTLMNSQWRRIEAIAAAFRRYRGKSTRRAFPFLRIESPFISGKMKGYQHENDIFPIGDDHLATLQRLRDCLRLLTFAPEIPGADRLIAAARANGVFLSMGHSNASYRDFAAAHAAGVRHITHYGNRSGFFHHREIGLPGAGMMHDDVFLEIIGDGAHTAPEFVELLWKIKPLATLALISDAAPPAFQSDAALQRVGFSRDNGFIRHRDGTVAGGETTILAQIGRFHRRGVIPLAHLVEMTSRNPRRFLGLRPRPGQVTVVDGDFRFLALARSAPPA